MKDHEGDEGEDVGEVGAEREDDVNGTEGGSETLGEICGERRRGVLLVSGGLVEFDERLVHEFLVVFVIGGNLKDFIVESQALLPCVIGGDVEDSFDF